MVIIIKLQRFDKRKKNKIFFIGLFIVIFISIVGISIYRSYASYQTNESFNILKGIVPNFTKNDIELAYSIDGVKASSFPTTTNYKAIVDCGTTATGKWDYTEWAAVIKNATTEKVKCSISFTSLTETFADSIFTLATTDTTNMIVDDETSDHNTRYIGKDPSNYLCFDSDCTNGKWRIIGVMNNMITSSGEKQSLVKIIRSDSIGYYAWDSNGSNDWSTASLKTYLNGDWYTANLEDYDNLIESVVWNLGGYSSNAITTSAFYGFERGTEVYSGRSTKWTGKLALMYPSDFGYATSGGDTGRDICLTYTLGNWSNYSDCDDNNFLFFSFGTWTLTPYSNSSVHLFFIYGNGSIHSLNDGASNTANIYPSLYLKSNTQILSGSGTNDDPFIIGLDTNNE